MYPLRDDKEKVTFKELNAEITLYQTVSDRRHVVTHLSSNRARYRLTLLIMKQCILSKYSRRQLRNILKRCRKYQPKALACSEKSRPIMLVVFYFSPFPIRNETFR